MNKSDAIRILELSNIPTKIEIKKAFRQKAKLLHPDQNKNKNSEEAFMMAYEAYNFLMEDREDKTPKESKHQHFRNQNHYSRHHQQQRAWYASTYEERLNQAKATSEKLENERSQRIYAKALQDYKTSWQRKAMVVISIIALACISFFSFETLEKPRMQIYSSSDYQVNVDNIDRPSYFFISIAKQNVEITPDFYLLLKKEPATFIVYQTPILGDIVEVKAVFTTNNETLKLPMPINIYSSFPFLQILLLIPFLSFFTERPKFSFVFSQVYFSLYIVPFIILILWTLNNRFLRLLDI